MRPLHWIAVLLFAPTLAAQTSLTFFEGSSPSDLRLRVVDETGPTAPPVTVLSGLRIAPLEITNRTSQQSLRSDRPRLVTTLGVPRLELAGNGRLLRYARAGGAQWGFLWIRPDGGPQVVLELPGRGVGLLDPFADRFGIASDGRHAAFVSAGGVLHMARLDGGVYASTGGPARPLALPDMVDPVSVCVGPSHVFFHTEDDRIWRCALADAASPEDVTPAGLSGARLKEEMAPSGDGTAVAFLYGPQDLFGIYLLRSTGAARRLPPPAAKYEEPGYLPETPLGPRMMLDEPASRLLYTDSTNREEIYLLDTSGATATTHVTSDPNFAPYIGTGILPAFFVQVLVLAVGDETGFDWFIARTGQPAVVNVTATATQGPPFTPGTLFSTAAYATEGAGMLIEEPDGTGSTQLRRVAAGGTATQIVARRLRASLALGRAAGAPNLLVPGERGDTLFSPALATLVPGPPGVLLSSDEQLVGGSASVFTASLPAGPGAAVFLVPGFGLIALPPDPALREVAVTPGGGLLLNGTTLLYARPGVAAVIPTTGTLRAVLSRAR